MAEEKEAEPPVPTEAGEVPSPLAAQSNQDELEKLDRHLKITTVVVAILALIASASSASAAWASWRTANASEQIAREVARTSGAYLELDNMVGLFGKCGDTADPLVAVATVENQGRIAGRVRSLIMYVDIYDRSALPREVTNRLEDVNFPAPAPGGSQSIFVAEVSNVVVNPQDSVELRMPVNCESLHVLNIDPVDAKQQLRFSILRHDLPWKLAPDFTFGDNETVQPWGVYGSN
ncbi:hypothetical protein AU198_14535 [Mycobacterium sp. GA-1199]|uniref:hypothetical protein n=1 Tax=Mycobacterium sp. GA-1199 TaxID=1772287 RepID=UPI00074A0A9B|nr:hypothetical protein [Mycobacterium sp. GA-1199]KUI44748.1 hypothetical protein AU198_14535 [Mycobacterium sp. GA-1199]